MHLRRATSRSLLAIALLAAPASLSCAAHTPAHSHGPAGEIEALREGQEVAQQRIEAEGRTRAQEVKREQEARLAEVEGERDDRTGRVR